MHASLRIFRLALATSLMISTALFVAWSIHWPLVGDASIIHYVAFLIQHGMAPYRDINEMSIPGSYLIELAGMHLFGPGALAWRIFDFTLLAIAAAAFAILTRRAGWFPAVFAATLFALVHGRDGLAQGGQRDLTMGILLIAATAALALALRHRSLTAIGIFGLLAGLAITIKPTVVPLSLAQLLIALYVVRRRREPVAKLIAPATVSAAICPLIALAFLVQQHAAQAFWTTLTGIVAYYTTLGHKPLGFLLLHSISPLLSLVLIWFAVLAFARPRIDWERALLLSGVAFGLLSYLLQARGFPYFRYPLLAFLIPILTLDFTEASSALKARPIPAQGNALAYSPTATGWAEGPAYRIAAALALLALAVGGLFLGPQSAILIHRYRWQQDDFGASLEQNLNRLGGQQLSGNIQCIDSINGCVTTLYKMRLLPATGMVLDFPLFGDSKLPVVQASRTTFREHIFEHPPQVLIVTSALYVDGPGDFQKLALWPELPDFLARDYTLDTDWHPTRPMRWWSREELGPSYRIYVRR
jgi:hypothetical protein